MIPIKVACWGKIVMELRRIELRSSRMQSEHSTTELQPLYCYSRDWVLVQSSRYCSDNMQNDIVKQNKIACYEGKAYSIRTSPRSPPSCCILQRTKCFLSKGFADYHVKRERRPPKPAKTVPRRRVLHTDVLWPSSYIIPNLIIIIELSLINVQQASDILMK